MSRATGPGGDPAATAKDPGAVVGNPAAPAAGLTLNDGQPLGFYDPDTGRGAIVLSNGSQNAGESFVVWSQTTGADGSYLLKNVGSGSAADPNPVISFNAPADAPGFSAPSFFVTREAVDATAAPPAAPGGPVVAAPPSPKP